MLFTRQFGSDLDDKVTDTAVGGGRFVVAGITEGSFAGTSSGLSDAFVRVFTTSGDVQYSRQMGSAGNESGSRVLIGTDNSVYLAANSSGAIGVQRGGEDVVIRAYDGSGGQLFTRQIGSIENEILNGFSF